MEKLSLKIDSTNSIIEYRDNNNLTCYEHDIITEVLNFIEQNDEEKLA